jgi:hypothetical protein
MDFRKKKVILYSHIQIISSSRINNSQIPFEIYEAAYEEEPEEERS